MKLCTHPDANVRGMAFDALRSIGVTDVPGFVVLLNHENAEIGRLASELVPGFAEVPAAAVPALIEALKQQDRAHPRRRRGGPGHGRHTGRAGRGTAGGGDQEELSGRI